MASNLRLIDDWAKTLTKLVPIVENSREAKIMHKNMSDLRDDICYIKEQLEIVGKSMDELQIEVNHALPRESWQSLYSGKGSISK